MITLRKSAERGHADLGWLDSYHTFSFADYHDPRHMHFRSLRVINEDRLAPGMGFPTHPHRDMEIITYVVSGALRHQDSLGTTAVMGAGDVQRISAGSGVTHSEFNNSPKEPVHLLQIWILPDVKSAPPGYAEKSFAQIAPGALQLITSKLGRDGSIPINQDVSLFAARMVEGGALQHSLEPGRHAWLQLIEGSAEVNGEKLEAGDAAAVSDEAAVDVRTDGAPAHFLLFDLN